MDDGRRSRRSPVDDERDFQRQGSDIKAALQMKINESGPRGDERRKFYGTLERKVKPLIARKNRLIMPKKNR